MVVALLGNLLGSGGYDIEDLRSYFIPTEMLFAMAVGLGLAALAYALRGEHGLSRPAGFGVALLSFSPSPVSSCGGARGRPARSSRAGPAGAPDRCRGPGRRALIGHGDGLMFGLWYERFVRGGRADLDILNRDLLAQDFYIGLANHFTPRMRWPRDIDAHDGRLNPVAPTLRATVWANYGHRPIIALRDYDALLGCRREEWWALALSSAVSGRQQAPPTERRGGGCGLGSYGGQTGLQRDYVGGDAGLLLALLPLGAALAGAALAGAALAGAALAPFLPPFLPSLWSGESGTSMALASCTWTPAGCGGSVIRKSTRRFLARPASVLFSATGFWDQSPGLPGDLPRCRARRATS